MNIIRLVAAGSLLCLCSSLAEAALISRGGFDEAGGITAVDSGSAVGNGGIMANVAPGTTCVFGIAPKVNNDVAQVDIGDVGNASGLFAAIGARQSGTLSMCLSFLVGGGSTPTVRCPSFINNFETVRLGRSAPGDSSAGSVDELRIHDISCFSNSPLFHRCRSRSAPEEERTPLNQPRRMHNQPNQSINTQRQ